MLRPYLCLSFLLCAAARAYAVEVCNAGYPGENSAQVLRHLPDALAACSLPDTVVLFVGMNDAANPARFLTPQQTRENVVQILRGITAAHARGLVVTVHVPDVARLLQRHTLKEYDDRLPQQRIDDTDAAVVQAAQQQAAILVDFRAVLAAAGGADAALSTDGVHLTKDGYHLLAATVAQALPKNANRVLCLGDSLTYGIGVRAPGAPDKGSASYPQQLQALRNGAL